MDARHVALLPHVELEETVSVGQVIGGLGYSQPQPRICILTRGRYLPVESLCETESGASMCAIRAFSAKFPRTSITRGADQPACTALSTSLLNSSASAYSHSMSISGCDKGQLGGLIMPDNATRRILFQ